MSARPKMVSGPVCWSSYSKTQSNAGPPNTKSFLVSVILDAGAWAAFSGIQVLVVYKESEWLNDVVRLRNPPDAQC